LKIGGAKRRANVRNLGFYGFYRSGEPQTLCVGQGKGYFNPTQMFFPLWAMLKKYFTFVCFFYT
jgi:hypothetical protein